MGGEKVRDIESEWRERERVGSKERVSLERERERENNKFYSLQNKVLSFNGF